MGKSSSDTPTYDRSAAQAEQIQAAELARKYSQVGVSSDTGAGYEWYTDPATGLQTVRTTSAGTDLQRSALGSSLLKQVDPRSITSAYAGLQDFSTDPTAAADAYYNASTRYLTQDYEKSKERASADLIAKGVPVGSSAYNQAMQELDDSYARALQTAADTAVARGQEYQTQALQNEIARAGALAGATTQNISLGQALTQAQYDPLSVIMQGAGGQFGGTYDAEYAARVAKAKADAEARSAGAGAIGSLVGTVGGAALGSIIPGVGTAIGASLGNKLGGSAAQLF